MAMGQGAILAIKINNSPASNQGHSRPADHELRILQHVSIANRAHVGRRFVRRLLDAFTIDGPSDKHLCLVLEPLREPLWLYRRRFVDDIIPAGVLKIMVQMILEGLDYLHSECQIIHAGMCDPRLY